MSDTPQVQHHLSCSSHGQGGMLSSGQVPNKHCKGPLHCLEGSCGPLATNCSHSRTPGLELQAVEQAARLAALTQSDPNDPLRQQYGDSPLIQSRSVTGRKWTAIDKLTPALEGQKVRRAPEGCA